MAHPGRTLAPLLHSKLPVKPVGELGVHGTSHLHNTEPGLPTVSLFPEKPFSISFPRGMQEAISPPTSGHPWHFKTSVLDSSLYLWRKKRRTQEERCNIPIPFGPGSPLQKPITENKTVVRFHNTNKFPLSHSVSLMKQCSFRLDFEAGGSTV